MFPRYICDINRSQGDIEVPFVRVQLVGLTLGQWVNTNILNLNGKRNLSQDIKTAMLDLTDKEIAVLKRRYEIGDENEREFSRSEIAKMDGVSRTRICQIENTALFKLRRHRKLKQHWLGL